MSPEEAKNKMEEMVNEALKISLPVGFSFSIEVSKDIADLAKEYFNSQSPFGEMSRFAAGEIFYYKGIRCYATNVTRMYQK